MRSTLTIVDRWMRTNWLRIELRLEMAHRFPHEMRLRADVQADVVAGRLAPVDVGGAARSSTRPLDLTTSRSALGSRGCMSGKQGEQLPSERRGLPLRELFARVRERRLESLRAERLEQVVERVNLERAQRVLVERRDEDDGRHPVGPSARATSKPSISRHLDVEKHQIRRRLCDRGHGLRRRSQHSPTTSMSASSPQQRQHARPCDRLVVHDQRPDPASCGTRVHRLGSRLARSRTESSL